MGAARFLVAFAFAGGVTFGLFYLMQSLIGVEGELDESKQVKVVEALRKHALRYPEVDAGAVCANTAFKAGKKSFFFLGVRDDHFHVRVKLTDSYADAEKLAKKSPDTYEPGMHGWTKATFQVGEAPPRGLLERWIEESYRNLAPKKLVAQIPEGGLAPGK